MIKHLFSRNNIIILLMGIFITIPFNIIIAKNFNLIFFSDLLVTLVVTLVVLSVFSFNRYVLIGLFAFFTLCNALFFYMNYFMNVDININIIMAFLNTDKKETLEQLSSISLKAIPFALVFFISPVYLSLKYKIQYFSIKRFLTEKLALIIIFLVLTIISLLSNLDKLNKDIDAKGMRNLYYIYNLDITKFPINYFYNVGKYLATVRGDFTFSDIPTKQSFIFKNKNQPINIVLVIGETARADRFSLAGYYKKTNPLLEKRKNLIFFDNFYSCNTGTIPSVTCLMGFKSGTKFRKNLVTNLTENIESFIPIFKNANFDTYVISTNSLKAEDPMFQRFKDAESIAYLAHSLGYRDGDIVNELKHIINKNDKNKLIILHTMGSHYKYAARYPKEFEKWSPVCSGQVRTDITACEKEYLDNEYNNTILYTDYVLDSFMSVLNNSNSMLIYTSDHGESLGETGADGKQNFYHGTSYDIAPINQIHVPAIIWFSDSWLKNFGKQQLINAQSKKKEILNHDFISFSILDCAFMESPFIDKSLSFCSFNKPKKVTIRPNFNTKAVK